MSPWFWFSVVALGAWGIVGLLQKLSTNEMSSESALVWVVVGFILVAPIFYPGKILLTYPVASLLYILASAALNAVGSWALLAAMRNGGKASIVVPLTALYPLLVALIAPFILRESVSSSQVVGVVCALMAVMLLST